MFCHYFYSGLVFYRIFVFAVEYTLHYPFAPRGYINVESSSDIESAAPPLADISIGRVHTALVPAQLVMPEH